MLGNVILTTITAPDAAAPVFIYALMETAGLVTDIVPYSSLRIVPKFV